MNDVPVNTVESYIYILFYSSELGKTQKSFFLFY